MMTRQHTSESAVWYVTNANLPDSCHGAHETVLLSQCSHINIQICHYSRATLISHKRARARTHTHSHTHAYAHTCRGPALVLADTFSFVSPPPFYKFRSAFTNDEDLLGGLRRSPTGTAVFDEKTWDNQFETVSVKAAGQNALTCC